jgi:hypothetical protein
MARNPARGARPIGCKSVGRGIIVEDAVSPSATVANLLLSFIMKATFLSLPGIATLDGASALFFGMIDAYKAGIPANGKPVPDGAKMAKIHWKPKQNQYFPDATVPGEQHDVDFMAKDSKRFADSGGWGYAAFKYDAASDTFTPFTTADTPPQANDAKCGFACHTVVKSRDYVFTEYGHR